MQTPTPTPDFRDVCLRCRRPLSVCWCGAVTQVPSRTRVVFIQHPREAKVPISTCRMAHLSLPNSALHIGLRASVHPSLQALAGRLDVAVLFPSDTATDVDDVEVPPAVLVVVDGTWSNARKVVEGCPVLSKLPRLRFYPHAPGNYRIRREPSEECLSTIEATALVLERLEGAPGRFTPILTAFDTMVEQQLAFAAANSFQSRHANRRGRNVPPQDPTDALQGHSLVVVFGEMNAWPMHHPDRPKPDLPELLQLVAERVGTGERFNRLMRPARPLGPRVPQHLDLSAEQIARGDDRAEVMSAWRDFLRPGDVVVGWGSYCAELLAREGCAPAEFLNLRTLMARIDGGPPGSVESRAETLGAVLGGKHGRAQRRLAALAYVTRTALGGRAALLPRAPA